MGTLREFQESLTIFYSKKTGIITSFSTGIQTFEHFGENAEDMKIIYDIATIPYNEDVINNSKNYKVDTTSKQLVKVVTSVDQQQLESLQNENKTLKETVDKLVLASL